MTRAPSLQQIELASRVLSRRSLLPFVQRLNERYLAGWLISRRCPPFAQRSDSAPVMYGPFRRQIGFVGQIGRREGAEHDTLSIQFDLSPPTRPMLAHAEVASLVVNLSAPYVLGVRLMSYLTQVTESVVVSDAVKVIDRAFWPLTCHPEPGEPMPTVEGAVHAHYDVPARVDTTSVRPDTRIPGDLYQPSKAPGGRVICKHLSEATMGEGRIRFVHCVCSLKTTWWEVTLRACKPRVSRNYILGVPL